jgi:hypothetical protein
MTDKIAKQQTALEVPKGLEGMITHERPAGRDEGTLGNEGINRDDVLMPRLAIAQKMSPEIDKTQADRYVEGLEFTDLYHSLTKKIYGKGPLYFVLLRIDPPRWIEFNPLSQGGGIKDKNVRAGDPRTEFHGAEKPIATKFLDFLVLLLNDFDPTDPMQNIVMLSFKSSGLAAAGNLLRLIDMRGQKQICKGVYKLSTGSKTDKKTQGVYAIYKIENAGWLASGSDLEKLAVELFEVWKDRKVVVDDDQFVDPDAFDAEKVAEM